jgi:hypothetical protein
MSRNSVRNYNHRLLVFPPEGTLLVCSDLHGNLADFQLMVRIFIGEDRSRPADTYLLFLGDLIHGPASELSPDSDLDNLFWHYQDRSKEIINAFRRLKATYPKQVHSLLGNHEHSHLGGPETAKFHFNHHTDTSYLEEQLGEKMSEELLATIEKFPLAAITPGGIVFTHGAPSGKIASLQDILHADYYANIKQDANQMHDVPVFDLLWLRAAAPDDLQKFFALFHAASHQKYCPKVSIYGHDVAEEGFYRDDDQQLLLSTSFRTPETNKTYLKIDLRKRYLSSFDLQPGKELMPLYQ